MNKIPFGWKVIGGFLFIDYVMRWFFPKETYWLLKLSAAFLPLPLSSDLYFSNLRGFSTWINRFYGFISPYVFFHWLYERSLKRFSAWNNKKLLKIVFIFCGRKEMSGGEVMHEKNRRFQLRITPKRIIKKIQRVFFATKFTIFLSIMLKPPE